MDHAGELALACIDIQQVRQPAVEIEQGEGTIQSPVSARLERNHPERNPLILLRPFGDGRS